MDGARLSGSRKKKHRIPDLKRHLIFKNKGLTQLYRLRADNDLVLHQLALKTLAQRTPIGSVELVRHDLDQRDAVPLLLAAVLPEVFTGRPEKARNAAEPVRQLFEKCHKPLPAYGLTSANFFRKKDLHEMGRPAAHDALPPAHCRASFRGAFRS